MLVQEDCLFLRLLSINFMGAMGRDCPELKTGSFNLVCVF